MQLKECKIEGCSYFPVMDELCSTHLTDCDSPFKTAVEATKGKRLHIITYGVEQRRLGLRTVQRWLLMFDNVFLADTSVPQHVVKWLELIALVPEDDIQQKNKEAFIDEMINPNHRIQGRVVGYS